MITGLQITVSCQRKPTENLFQPARKKSFYIKKAGQKVVIRLSFHT